MLKIRKAAIEDVPSMSALLKELFKIESGFAIDEAKQRRGLELLLSDEARACAMVAVDEKGLVSGMATLQLLASSAEGAFSGWIEDLVVASERRGEGAGRALLDALIEWGEARGATRFQLLADKGNGEALAFYERAGWSGTSMICLRRKRF